MRPTNIRRSVVNIVTISNMFWGISSIAIVVPEESDIRLAYSVISNHFMHETHIGSDGKSVVKLKSFADVYIFAKKVPHTDFDIIYRLK